MAEIEPLRTRNAIINQAKLDSPLSKTGEKKLCLCRDYFSI